jgi:biotin-dependent carboxylase-like uncharacterized protein
MREVLEILSPGGGCSLQDRGRPGWKRFGVAEGGAMDRDSAIHANRLVGNPDDAPVVELCLTGARLKVLEAAEFAVAGADGEGSHPRWRNFEARPGEEISFGALRSGAWSYLAVRGGFTGPKWFGSVSVNARAGLGRGFAAGDRVWAGRAPGPAIFTGRFIRPEVRQEFCGRSEIPLWPGPEWSMFPQQTRALFLEILWSVSPQSDRSGYRLEGPMLPVPALSIVSSPLRVGVIQIPPSGQPLVILHDGPTVGGYPRLAIMEPDAVSQFTQRAPGTPVRFRLNS